MQVNKSYCSGAASLDDNRQMHCNEKTTCALPPQHTWPHAY